MVEYIDKIKENVPLLEELDDLPVSDLKAPEPVATPTSNLNPMVKRFLDLGISMSTIDKLTSQKLKQIEKEHTSEEMLLVTTIKN